MRKHLTDEEYKALKAYLATDFSHAGRIIELILYTGMRESEACMLDWDSLDVSAKALRIRAVKDSAPRLVPLGPSLIDRSKPFFNTLYARKAKAGQMISDSIGLSSQTRSLRRYWKRISMKALGNYPVTLHGLRHSFGGRVFAATSKNLLKTQRLMGHKNVNSTVRYMEYFETLECRDDVLIANGD